MNDIIDINVYENTEEVTINVTPEVVQVNVNRVNGVVEYADQTETNAGVISDKSIAPNTLSGWWVYVKTLAQTFSEKITFSLGALFSPQVAPTHERGRIYFDDVNDCISFMDSISGTSVQVGYETLMRARNNTGDTIPNGALVYISGAIGQNPTIALAQANTEPTSEIIGVATHSIANNTVGKVCVFGLVNDINTSAFNDGDFLYLSSSVAGGLTTTPPSSPNFVVSVGVVEHAHPTQGKILVKPQRALSNNNTLGNSQKVSVTENVVKTNLDLKQNTLVSGTTIKTIEGQSILGSGNIDLNKADVGLSNVPNLDTSTTLNITDSTNKRFVTDAEKTAITHSNRSILDAITESFTTALKTAYDSTVTWISTNGTNILNHISSTSNPHNVTKTQVGLSNVDNTSDVNKPISTATQTVLNLKENLSNKATNLISPDNTKYPTTLAISTALAGKQDTLTNPITGTGTTNFLSKFTGSGNIGNSQIFDNGTNVGIGTTSPGSLLNLNNGDTFINVTDTLRGLQFGYSGPTHGSYRAAVMGGAELYGGSDSGMLTFHTQNGYAVSSVPPERMRITSTGNVGIGTTTPREKLHVIGNLLIELNDDYLQRNVAQIKNLGESGVTGAVNWSLRGVYQYNNGVFGNSVGGDLDLIKAWNGNTILATKIDGTPLGNVGIGTTTPSARLDVRAQGALATDIAFVVRNSTDTQNFLVVNGAGDVYNRGAQGVSSNTFFGENVGRNTTGNNNTAIGLSALSTNTTGNNNTAIGVSALTSNTTGIYNTAIGVSALTSNTTGFTNTAIGFSALVSNTLGYFNTAIGGSALFNNTTGNFNTAIGIDAGALISNGSNNTITDQSIFIGFDTRALANNQSNQIVIGHSAIGLGSNSVVLGNTSITRTQLRGQVIMGSFASDPTGIEGAIYYNSTTKKHYGFDGTTWNALY